MAAAKTATTPVSTPVAWAIAFLHQIGAPVTPNNIATVIKWGTAESGSPSGAQQSFGGWANFNPLNVVVQSNDGHTGQGGTQGDIANFGSIAAGAAASARLFKANPNAAGIIASLRADAPAASVQNAVRSFYSTWGGSITFAGLKADLTHSPAHQANTTSFAGDVGGGIISGILGPFGGVLGNNPITGIVNAGKATGTLAGLFIGIFQNWRYVAEVVIGGFLVIIGMTLIAIDTGAAKKATQAGGTAAGLAVLA